MGKKSRQESLKPSNKEKKQLHNLIKYLRPKVYITDCSSFKSLVQELTGNGSTSSILSPPTSSISSPTAQNDVIMDVEGYQEPERSIDVSLDASVDSIEFSNYQASNTQEEPSPWLYDSCIDNDILSNCLLMNQCDQLESLVDIDHHTLYSNYSQMFYDGQLGGCDYDLSELLY